MISNPKLHKKIGKSHNKYKFNKKNYTTRPENYTTRGPKRALEVYVFSVFSKSQTGHWGAHLSRDSAGSDSEVPVSFWIYFSGLHTFDTTGVLDPLERFASIGLPSFGFI